MLSSLRNAAGSLVAKIFLGLLVLSFMVWGVSGSLVTGPGAATVEFGDTRVGLAEYRLAYNTQILSFSRQFGQQLTGEQAKALGIEQSVFAQVVAGAVMDENAKRLGMGLSDKRLGEMIAKDENFRDANGAFSRTMLQFVVRNAGMSEEAYVRNRKSVAVRRQFFDSVAAAANSPDAFFSAFGQYETEKRVLEFVEVDAAAAGAAPVPADTDLQKFYDINKVLFVAPEYRKIAVIRLTADDLAKPDDVSAEAIAESYEAKKATYITPEQRRVQQLAFADKAAAEAALKRIREGELFETILSESGKQAADTDLGLVTKLQIPDATIAEAAFKLALNGVSDVVEGIFGPVLLRVIEIAPETTKTLEEVSGDIRKTLALEKAAEELFDAHDKIEDGRAAGDTLEDATSKAGLTVRLIDNVDIKGNGMDGAAIANIPEAGKLLVQAFQSDVGDETDPLPIGADGFVWFEVKGVTPERQKPLEEVRAEASAKWVEAEIERKIDAIALSLRDKVAGGEDFAKLASETLPARADGTPASLETSVPLGRRDTSDRLAPSAIAAAFSVPAAGVTVAASGKGTNKLVIRVASVTEGVATPAPETLKSQIAASVSDDLLGALIEDLQSRAELTVNRRAIETALGR